MTAFDSVRPEHPLGMDIPLMSEGVHLAVSKSDPRASKVAIETFQEYHFYLHPRDKLAYVIKKNAAISSPRLEEEIARVRKAIERTLFLSKIKKDPTAYSTRIMGPRSIQLDHFHGEIPHTGKLTIDPKTGLVCTRHVVNGKQQRHRSNLTPTDVDVMLRVVKKMIGPENHFIKLIADEGRCHEFLKINSHHRVHLLHRGQMIGSGGGGSVYKVWDLMRNQVMANKHDIVTVTRRDLARRGSDIIREASLIKLVNPGGTKVGLQKCPRIIYQIQAPDLSRGIEVQNGFIGPFYDGDLALLLEKQSLSTKQIIRGLSQIFHGIEALNTLSTPVINLDIKIGNVFIKFNEGVFDLFVADFDQMHILDEVYFESEDFVRDLMPLYSPDSVTSTEAEWFTKVGEAIIVTKQKINELNSSKKKESKKMRKEMRVLSILEDKYIELAKRAHIRAIAFVAYQMLLGDVVLDAHDVDLSMLIQKIEGDSSLNDKGKARRKQIVHALRTVLEEIPIPPKGSFTHKTSIPKQLDISTLLLAIEGE